MSLSTWLNYKTYKHVRNADEYKRQEKLLKLLEGHPEEEHIIERIIQKKINTNYVVGWLGGTAFGTGLGFLIMGFMVISYL
ncbi:MAG TPA: hypothetical protein VMY59_08790 [Candidatus Thermoplasmatota archaeon]|nr:hypothetical protein [Candidatus Thermoplasmatota archaeon]